VQNKQSKVSVRARAGVVLEVKDLRATVAGEDKEVLKGVNLTVHEGEVAAIMGKNGSGKSTLSKVLVGHPDYEVTSGTVMFKGQNLLDLEPQERARAGLFLSFQAPIEVPGVNNVDFLRMAANARRTAQGKEEFEPLDFYMHLTPKVCRPGTPWYVVSIRLCHISAVCTFREMLGIVL
jgi:Fe-S cluster assembly ATP-binding protein